jgi:glycosyltransferase involved in cell wall biosynthesis
MKGISPYGHRKRRPPGDVTGVLLVEEGGVGGVADYTAELAAALARAGWRVDVATARDHGYPPALGVTLHARFPYVRGRSALGRAIRRARLSKAVNGITHLVANMGLLRLARTADVVHVQGGEWPPLGALQALLVRALGRPLVWTPHNTFDRGARAYARSRALTDRWAARLVIHTEHDRAALPAATAAKAVVIPHGEYGGLARRGAPDADPQAARAQLGAGEDELVVLLFGQLRADKGVRDLLLAAAQVPEIRAVLAGEDKGALAEVADLRADARLAGRLVVREGFVPAQEAGRLFAAADVAALPYHRASASGVLLLACGYARPAVAYPVGGLPEYVVDGETGWLCARADPDALAEQLRAIVTGGRAACRSRGTAARRLADERFSWDAIARRTAELYEDASGRRIPPRAAYDSLVSRDARPKDI